MESGVGFLKGVTEKIIWMVVYMKSNDHEEKHGSSNSHSHPTKNIAIVSHRNKQDSRIDEWQQVQDGCVKQTLLAELVLILNLLVLL